MLCGNISRSIPVSPGISVNYPSLSASLPVSTPISIYTSLASFLLCAIALVVPSGYSLGAVMLLLLEPSGCAGDISNGRVYPGRGA